MQPSGCRLKELAEVLRTATKPPAWCIYGDAAELCNQPCKTHGSWCLLSASVKLSACAYLSMDCSGICPLQKAQTKPNSHLWVHMPPNKHKGFANSSGRQVPVPPKPPQPRDSISLLWCWAEGKHLPACHYMFSYFLLKHPTVSVSNNHGAPWADPLRLGGSLAQLKGPEIIPH